MIEKSRLDIERDFDEQVRSRRPGTATAKGTFIGDVVKLPLSNELSKMWFVMDWVQATRSIKRLGEIDADDQYKSDMAVALNIDSADVQDVIDTAVDDLAYNFDLTRKSGDYAYAYVLFLRDTLVAGDAFTVTAGDLVGTQLVDGVQYQFSVAETTVMDGDRADYYRNVATQYQSYLDDMSFTELYAMRVKVTATAVGSAYNVGSEAINKIVTSGDFTNVLNPDAVLGGADEESNEDLLERARKRYKGVAIGNAVAYASAIMDALTGVSDVLVVGAEHPLMRRDLFPATAGWLHVYAKGDVYILGKDPEQVTEEYIVDKASYLGATPYDTILDNQPVESIDSVIGASSGPFTEGTDFLFIKDYGNFEGSIQAEDLIRWLDGAKSVIAETVTRGGILGGQDTPAVGRLLSITEIWDNPEVLAATPLCDGTWTLRMDPYPYYPATPLGATPVYFSVSRIENLTNGYEYDLTGLLWGSGSTRDYLYLSTTPNVGKAAPLVTDSVEIDYRWSHYYIPLTEYQVTTFNIDWAPAGTVMTDPYGAYPQPYPGANYYASYVAEAPLFGEVLDITYTYDKKVGDAQTAIEEVRPLTDDIVVKQANQVLIDVELTVVSDSQYTDTELKTRISTAISQLLSKYMLGDFLDQSDIIAAIVAADQTFIGTTVNLVGGISEIDTEIPVISTADFSSAGTIYIGEEQVTYQDITTTAFLNCTRGANGTSAASHINGTAVTYSKTGQPSASGTGVERIVTLPLTKMARRILGYVLVNSEYIAYSGVTANTLTGLTRGYRSTLAAAHLNGSVVKAATTLSSVVDIAATATEIPVMSTKLFPATGTITIGTEIILYTGITATSFIGCTRGYSATTAAIHADGDEVSSSTTLTASITDSATTMSVAAASALAYELSRTVIYADDVEYVRSGSVTVTVQT